MSSSVGLFHHFLVYMGDLHLVHPALNLSPPPHPLQELIHSGLGVGVGGDLPQDVPDILGVVPGIGVEIPE